MNAISNFKAISQANCHCNFQRIKPIWYYAEVNDARCEFNQIGVDMEVERNSENITLTGKQVDYSSVVNCLVCIENELENRL